MKSLFLLPLLAFTSLTSPLRSSDNEIRSSADSYIFQFVNTPSAPTGVNNYYDLEYSIDNSSYLDIYFNTTINGYSHSIVISSVDIAFYLGSNDTGAKNYYGVTSNGWYTRDFDYYEAIYPLTQAPRINIYGGEDMQDLISNAWFLSNSVHFGSDTFEYQYQYDIYINYNAVAGEDIETLYFRKPSEWVVSGLYQWSYRYYLINDTPFMANGELYTDIYLVFRSIEGQRFYYNGQYTEGGNNNQYAFFESMVYHNKITGRGREVNRRNITIPVGEIVNQPYYTIGSTWVAPAYSDLYFTSALSQDNLDSLNLIYYEGGLPSIPVPPSPPGGGGEAVSSVFSLLSMAFASVASLLSIAVFPGITVGLLLFLPLVVAIIILIFWFLKR